MNQMDLYRAAASEATTAILLTNRNSTDAFGTDHKNILIGLAMKKYVYDTKGSHLRLCMQLIKPESKQHYSSSIGQHQTQVLDQIIIVEELKMNLLAKSCFAPGIISFISNLITSMGDDDDLDTPSDEP